MRPFANYSRACIRYCQALLCFGVSILFSVYFPTSEMITPEFGALSYGYKLIHLLGSTQSALFTYYAGFCCVEANLIASGFGYSRRKDMFLVWQENYNSVRQINILAIVFAPSFAEWGTNWNIQIHLWLKYYVMLRLMDRSQPKGAPQHKATLLTFIVSSLWHGTYPGFIIFFIACAMLEIQGKAAQKNKFVLWLK